MVTANRSLKGAVFVLGMHRSGTSALTRGLEVLGIDLGRNLKPPVSGDNERGFFEDWALSTINDELLAVTGDQWDSLSTDFARDFDDPAVRELKLKAIAEIRREFENARYFAFKDPRTCRVLPFWQDVLQRQALTPFYLIAFRNPLSVARSLAKRDGFSHARSYYLWLVHVLNAVKHTEGARRIFVEYDGLLADPEGTLSRIAAFIDDPQIAVSKRELDTYIREFIDGQLRHDYSLPTHLDLDPACSPLVESVYELLQQEANNEHADDGARRLWAPKLEAFALLAPHLELLEVTERSLRRSRQEATVREVKLQEFENNVVALQEALQRLDEVKRNEMQSVIDASSREIDQLRQTLGQTQDELQSATAAHAQEVAELIAAAQVSGKYISSLTEQFTAELKAERQQAAARAEELRRSHEVALRDAIRAERVVLNAERADAVTKIEATRRDAEAQIEAVQRDAGAEINAIRRHAEAVQRHAQEAATSHAATVEHLRSDFHSLATRLRETYRSSSWRLTGPLRAVKSILLGGAVDEHVPELSRPEKQPVVQHAQGLAACVPATKRRVHFTICAKNYLPIARVCLESSKRFHPDAEHCLVLCDVVEQGYDPSRESFGVIPVNEISIPCFADMALRYDVMELNTAVKPFCFTHFFGTGADEVVYLDPDLFFLEQMSEIRKAFDGGADAVLTPHINQPIEDDKSPGDRDMLRAGAYNLGFLALRRSPDSEAFARWWGDRLRMGAVSDIARGLFTDQKWCDLLPSFVQNTTVLHRPGYNLAYWNLMHRRVRRDGDTWTAAGEPICFAHFSGASFTDANVFSKHQNRYDANSIGPMRELYDRYRDEVRARGFGSGPAYRYAFDFDAQGRRIAPILRHIYRDELAPDRPSDAPDLSRVIAYSGEPAPDVKKFDALVVSRLMHRVWRTRPDLQAAFDLNSEMGQRGFIEWCGAAMPREYGIDECASAPTHQTAAPISAPQSAPQGALSGLSKTVLSHSSSLRPLYRHLPTRWRERAKVALTRSAYAQRATARTGAPRPGAALIGYARGELGMGEHVRMTAAALECEGVPMGIVNISENVLARQEDRRFDHLHNGEADFRANIFHVNADQLPTVTAGLGDQFLSGKRNIAYPAWELGKFPRDWAPQLNAMDEVWAPSRFIQDALAASIDRPVVHMPLAVEIARGYEKWRRADFGLPEDAFVFLFYFDLASFQIRKNPLGVIEAYRQAIGSLDASRGRKPLLVVKVISSDRFPAEFGQLQHLVGSVPGIVLMPEVFSADKIHGLINCSDAFVSLHRSEGFGRGPAEAMRLGKVAIATGFSGNMDYMNAANSFPVSYQMRAVAAHEYPYGEGQYWAEPNVAEAGQIMRKLVAEPGLARAVGEVARAYMAEHHSSAEVGKRYAGRLKIVGALG